MNNNQNSHKSKYAIELEKTYRSISVFRNIGTGMLAGGIWAGYYDWSEYSRLAVAGVHNISADDRDLTLLKGLKTSSQVLYLEQEIEKYLGIKNRKVRGGIGAEHNGFL